MASTEIPKVWYDGNCQYVYSFIVHVACQRLHLPSLMRTADLDTFISCAAVKYKVLLPSLDSYEIISCNCSICTRNGYLNIYPKREELVFSRGAETLKGYYFGNKDCEHKFCPNCGSSVLIDPHGRKSTEDLVGVNVSKCSS